MLFLLQLFSWFALFICLTAVFPPSTSDYNAYGQKVAANNLMIVQTDNAYSVFYIQFGNYTDNVTPSDDRFCEIEYPDSSFYIYTVALGKSQTAISNVFFVGELTGLDEQNNIPNRTFVGVLSYTGSFTSIDCANITDSLQIAFVQMPHAHQEHLVLVTDPLGTVAYGFSNLFTFSYTASNYLQVKPKNSLSPSVLFLPFAVDYDGNRGIIAGFLRNNRTGRTTYSATVILFSIDASTAIATQLGTWTYPSNSSAWQSGLTFTAADQYRPEYDMSVSINPIATQVLVGIQLMNAVFLFSYTTSTLTFVTSIDKGRGLGFGKSVAWLRDTRSSVAILANVYSTTYVWSSSNIHIYDSPLTSTSTPVSIFANSQQLLYSYMSSVFISIITTPDHLVFLDDQGSFFIILSAPPGYFASTTGPDVQTFIAFSSQLQCTSGTYKNVTGVRRCGPCPTGTKNDGTNPIAATCVDCAANTFCPLGSITDSISNDHLRDIIQVVAYPQSPDVTGLDDILFLTLFSIGSTGRCVALSPIFWTLIVGAIVILITVTMLIIKYCVKDGKAENSYKTFQKVFQRADLIREGDMWPGGLATFCVVVLCVFCCVFSAQYYTSYPIETVGPSTYTCDTTIRNAQFSSSLQPLSIPVSDNMKQMIDLLDNQIVNLDVSFLNTIYTCITSDVVTLTYLLGSTWRSVSPDPTCTSLNYIVSYSAVLPFRLITVQYTLPNTYIIGGLRIGLNAPGQNKSSTIMLQDLGFSQVLNQSGRMLGQNAYITLQLTKVINSTSPLVSGNDEVLSGIWAGSFTLNYYESFMTDTEYLIVAPQTSTKLTLVISETSYFILNEQKPIARLPEIVFHDFLFITMIIGMFVLIFIIIEVLILPCAKFLIRRCRSKDDDKQRKGDSRRPNAADDDLENSSSHSTKPAHIKKKLNIATVNDSGALQEQSFTSIQSANRSENGGHQWSPTWKHEAFL